MVKVTEEETWGHEAGGDAVYSQKRPEGPRDASKDSAT